MIRTRLRAAVPALIAAAALAACSDAEPTVTDGPSPAASPSAVATSASATGGDCKQAEAVLLVAGLRMAGVTVNIGLADPASPRAGLDKAAGVLDLPLSMLDEALPKLTDGAVKDVVQAVRTDTAAFQQSLKTSTDPDKALKAAETFADAVDAKTKSLTALCS